MYSKSSDWNQEEEINFPLMKIKVQGHIVRSVGRRYGCIYFCKIQFPWVEIKRDGGIEERSLIGFK